MMKRLVRYFAFAGLAAALLTQSGCRVDKHGEKGNEDVGVRTPFGGLTVKTDNQAIQQGVGLAVYPGATLSKQTEDKNKNEAADLNFSFGDFHIGVKALSYQSQDPPSKVMAFYRHDMARYGTVIQCRGRYAVGSPIRTADGLTCEDDANHSKGQSDVKESDSTPDQLKAGSPRHQHIVGIEAQGAGTKIGLVALELPEQMKHRSGSDEDGDKE